MPIGLDAAAFLESAAAAASAALDELASRDDELTPIVMERWQTAEDERVCPVCGPLDWTIWQLGYGPQPPLHRNCRCVRLLDRIEYTTRDAT